MRRQVIGFTGVLIVPRLSGLLGLLGLLGLGLAAPGAATAGEQPPPRIVVLGSGRIETPPDMVELGFAVEHTAPTAEGARKAAAASGRKVLDALTEAAGTDARVETVGYTLNPVYRPNPEPRHAKKPVPPEIVAYTAVHQISAESRRVEAVGTMIDAAIRAGAARIRNLNFTLRDPASAQDDALAAAGADAARQAKAVATSLGVRITKVLEASVERGGRPVYASHARMAMAESNADTPVAPGVVTTEARVHVTYGIE